LNKKMHPLGVL